MTEQDRIVERIRKLAALRESPNEHEAALAAAKMQEVLFKYNLDISVIHGVKENADKYERFHEFLGNVEWQKELFAVICRTNFCKAIHDGNMRDYMWVVGKTHNKEVVLYFYEYLSKELERLAEIGWTYQQLINLDQDKKAGVWARTWKKSFLCGAVQIVGQRLKEQQDKNKQENQQSMALMVVTGRELQTAVRDFFPRLGTHQAKLGTLHQDGFSQGQKAGASVGLNRGLNANPQGRKMLG